MDSSHSRWPPNGPCAFLFSVRLLFSLPFLFRLACAAIPRLFRSSTFSWPLASTAWWRQQSLPDLLASDLLVVTMFTFAEAGGDAPRSTMMDRLYKEMGSSPSWPGSFPSSSASSSHPHQQPQLPVSNIFTTTFGLPSLDT